MQFIPHGPDIPDDLLRDHEDGKVVFFCGAGISCPAGLPMFSDLARRLYQEMNVPPSAVQRAALDANSFDGAIGLLEKEVIGVRKQVLRILTPDCDRDGATATHAALLDLSTNRQGKLRLVSTNFDRIFEHLLCQTHSRTKRYQAPFLPVPKEQWSGLVYLHGLLPTDDDDEALNALVLTSGDFGRAYLTERWASRFVSELFRRYTVCFVGYGINDPVMRYILDALAGDALRGEVPPAVFAFADHADGCEAATRADWEAKSVAPVLYNQADEHSALHGTLVAWSHAYRDGLQGKVAAIIANAPANPATCIASDNFVGRVLWALQDSSGKPAQVFADLDPAPCIEWMDHLPHLAESMAASRPAEQVRKVKVPIFEASLQPLGVGPVWWQMGRWLTRHIRTPGLVSRVLRAGGVVNPMLAPAFQAALAKQSEPGPFEQFWSLVLMTSPRQPYDFGAGSDWLDALKLFGPVPLVRQRLRDLLSPRLRLKVPFRFGRMNEPPTQLADLVDVEVELALEHARHQLTEDRAGNAFQTLLPDLLPDLTTLVCDAMDMWRSVENADETHDHTYVELPSISSHPQNRDRNAWTFLVELLRDAWLAEARRSPDRAKAEVERWRSIGYPIFRRLTFFAATESDLFSSSEATTDLLSDGGHWLWNYCTRRECIRLMVKLVSIASAPELETVEVAILRGPPDGVYRKGLNPVEAERFTERSQWFLLKRYRAAGPLRLQGAIEKLAQLTAKHTEWRLAPDESDEFSWWSSSGPIETEIMPTPKEEAALARYLEEDTVFSDPRSAVLKRDNWQERCRDDFDVASQALVESSKVDWKAGRWQTALSVWREDDLAAKSWPVVESALSEVPDESIREIGNNLGWWLESVAKSPLESPERFVDFCSRFIRLFRGSEASDEDRDAVFVSLNHPVGQATGALLAWWYTTGLSDGTGIREDLKEVFTELCDTAAPGYRPGRTVLARHVISLFRVDTEWTTALLLPLFDWGRAAPDEARSAWQAFLWSPRAYLPLLACLHGPFLDTASHLDELGDQCGGQYASLLTFLAVENPGSLSEAELAKATGLFSQELVCHAVQQLTELLKGAGEQRAALFANRIVPYFEKVWPKQRARFGVKVSECLARFCVAAGDCFPRVVSTVTPWLQPPEHGALSTWELSESGLCSRFPEEALVFLGKTTPKGESFLTKHLGACLEQITGAEPLLQSRPEYRRLMDIIDARR